MIWDRGDQMRGYSKQLTQVHIQPGEDEISISDERYSNN